MRPAARLRNGLRLQADRRPAQMRPAKEACSCKKCRVKITINFARLLRIVHETTSRFVSRPAGALLRCPSLVWLATRRSGRWSGEFMRHGEAGVSWCMHHACVTALPCKAMRPPHARVTVLPCKGALPPCTASRRTRPNREVIPCMILNCDACPLCNCVAGRAHPVAKTIVESGQVV